MARHIFRKIEFQAVYNIPVGTTKFQVTTDKRRGLISLVKGEDGLLRFKYVV